MSRAGCHRGGALRAGRPPELPGAASLPLRER